MIIDGVHYVKQEHVRILREGLASISNRVPAPLSLQANQTLRLFGLEIREYCKHPEMVYHNKEMRDACLDCGKRFAPKTQPKEEHHALPPADPKSK